MAKAGGNRVQWRRRVEEEEEEEEGNVVTMGDR
jgi:hypothetical protein